MAKKIRASKTSTRPVLPLTVNPADWPAHHRELRALAELVPYARNARTHSPDQVAQIANLIARFGWTSPILISEAGGIIAGHGRVMAALRLGITEVPCIVATGWSESDVRAYVIADNQVAANAGWDRDLLSAELSALEAVGFDMSLVGFDDKTLAELVQFAERDGAVDADDAPAPPPIPVSRRGDLWLLGEHRLLCGDSTIRDDVWRVLGAGPKPILMVTDPPYGVNYDPQWRVDAGVSSAGAATGVVTNDHRADWTETWVLFPGDIAYVWHGGLHGGAVQASLEAAKFKLRAQIIWRKSRPVLSRGHYHWAHEPALYVVRSGAEDNFQDQPEPAPIAPAEPFEELHEVAAYAVRDGETGRWRGGRKQSTVWDIGHVKSETGHGTQKPIECMKRPILNNSRPGDRVYEPFSGSGTTIIACEMTGRAACALEIAPGYVDVDVRRWELFTGREAHLQLEDGSTIAGFAAVAAARGVQLAA